MSRNSNARTLYFKKHIEGTETPEAYVKALKESPYRQHRRAGEGLEVQLKEMVAVRDKEQREAEIGSFAKTLEI